MCGSSGFVVNLNPDNVSTNLWLDLWYLDSSYEVSIDLVPGYMNMCF